MLNSMASRDFAQACAQHAAWGLKWLDLKDAIFGKSITALSDAEARSAVELAARHGLGVYCFSTMLFAADVEQGEARFREQHLAPLARTLELARILRPRVIRLIAASTQRRAELTDSAAYVTREHPWLIALYREALRHIVDAGFRASIENEVERSLFTRPAEVLNFFEALGPLSGVSYTWDVQNMWQNGAYPSLEAYEMLRPLIGYFHLKGGQEDPATQRLKWSTGLAEATWPVVEITRQVMSDGVSPVICLNPSHGARKEGYDYAKVVERDVDFLRAHVPGIE